MEELTLRKITILTLDRLDERTVQLEGRMEQGIHQVNNRIDSMRNSFAFSMIFMFALLLMCIKHEVQIYMRKE